MLEVYSRPARVFTGSKMALTHCRMPQVDGQRAQGNHQEMHEAGVEDPAQRKGQRTEEKGTNQSDRSGEPHRDFALDKDQGDELGCQVAAGNQHQVKGG